MTEPEQPHDGDDLAADANPAAATAGEEDHSDPWLFAGEDADPPDDTGKPPADEDTGS